MPANQTSPFATQKKKILLVDDHPIVRAGFEQLINQENDLQVCATAGNPSQALEAIKKTLPDLAIIDISLDGSNGLELVKLLQSLYPRLLLFVLSMHPEAIYAHRTIKAGAKGYIMKQAPTDEVMRAIRLVLRGEIYLSGRMNEMVVKRLFGNAEPAKASALDEFTDRELEIFELIGRGVKTAEIAKKLNVSVKTVETHRAHIKEKLQLKDGMELINYAVRWSSQAGG
jgi:DNA-binding NarL/FixJ family response regulator